MIVIEKSIIRIKNNKIKGTLNDILNLFLSSFLFSCKSGRKGSIFEFFVILKELTSLLLIINIFSSFILLFISFTGNLGETFSISIFWIQIYYIKINQVTKMDKFNLIMIKL